MTYKNCFFQISGVVGPNNVDNITKCTAPPQVLNPPCSSRLNTNLVQIIKLYTTLGTKKPFVSLNVALQLHYVTVRTKDFPGSCYYCFAATRALVEEKITHAIPLTGLRDKTQCF